MSVTDHGLPLGWDGDITWQQSDEWDLGRAWGVSTTLIKPLSGYVCPLPQKLLHRIWMSFPLSLYLNFKLKKLVYLFIYLFLAVLSLHCCAWLSLVVACRLLTAVTSLVAEQRLDCCGCSGLVAPQHASSKKRDQICVSRIGRWILYHQATREATRWFWLWLNLHLCSIPSSCFPPLSW